MYSIEIHSRFIWIEGIFLGKIINLRTWELLLNAPQQKLGGYMPWNLDLELPLTNFNILIKLCLGGQLVEDVVSG